MSGFQPPSGGGAGGPATWGAITGTITAQTDLTAYVGTTATTVASAVTRRIRGGRPGDIYTGGLAINGGAPGDE